MRLVVAPGTRCYVTLHQHASTVSASGAAIDHVRLLYLHDPTDCKSPPREVLRLTTSVATAWDLHRIASRPWPEHRPDSDHDADTDYVQRASSGPKFGLREVSAAAVAERTEFLFRVASWQPGDEGPFWLTVSPAEGMFPLLVTISTLYLSPNTMARSSIASVTVNVVLTPLCDTCRNTAGCDRVL